MEYVILDEIDKKILEEAQEIMATTYFESFDKVTVENLILMVRDLTGQLSYEREEWKRKEQERYEMEI